MLRVILLLLPIFAFAEHSRVLDMVKLHLFVGVPIVIAGRSDILPIGMEFEIKAGWHMYANNPGDIGSPTVFHVSSNNTNLKTQIYWPNHSIEVSTIDGEKLVSNIYQNDVRMPIMIYLTDKCIKQDIDLIVDFALCGNDSCIPYKEKFSFPCNSGTDEKAMIISRWDK